MQIKLLLEKPKFSLMPTILSFAITCILVLTPMTAARAASTKNAKDIDNRLIAFLQKRFLLPNPSMIKLGPPVASSLPGIWSRDATLTNAQGASATISVFSDATGDKVIVGQVYDAVHNPWGRVSLKSLHLQDRPALGPANAPITMVEFADFECPYCAHATGILETAVESAFKGHVRLIFKNFPLNGHKWARNAAIASECVQFQNPDAFWAFARDFYRNQAEITEENLRDHIDSFAERSGLDRNALDACMLGKAAEAQVVQDIEDGKSVKVSSTPTIFVNGIPIFGTPNPESLAFVIRSELADHRASR